MDLPNTRKRRLGSDSPFRKRCDFIVDLKEQNDYCAVCRDTYQHTIIQMEDAPESGRTFVRSHLCCCDYKEPTSAKKLVDCFKCRLEYPYGEIETANDGNILTKHYCYCGGERPQDLKRALQISLKLKNLSLYSLNHSPLNTISFVIPISNTSRGRRNKVLIVIDKHRRVFAYNGTRFVMRKYTNLCLDFNGSEFFINQVDTTRASQEFKFDSKPSDLKD